MIHRSTRIVFESSNGGWSGTFEGPVERDVGSTIFLADVGFGPKGIEKNMKKSEEEGEKLVWKRRKEEREKKEKKK